MAQGEGGGGHYASSGGYPGGTGGMPGTGSASGNVSGAEPGMLGFGALSPGGFNSTAYAQNMGLAQLGGPGPGGIQGAIARGRARRAAGGASMSGPGIGANAPGPAATNTVKSVNATTGVVTEVPVDTPPATGQAPPIPKSAPPNSNFTNYNNWAQGAQTGQFPGATPNFDTPPDNQSVHIGEVNWGGFTGPRPGAAGRQFGGPVGAGQYTVGENGPETLRLGGGSRGMVTPHNPADRRAGLVAALGGGGGGGITGMGGGLGAPRPLPGPGQPRPATLPAPAPRPMAPAPRAAGGGWRG